METGTYTPLPSWITETSFLAFEVFTDDITNLGMHYISVIGTVPSQFMDDPYAEELLIELRVKDGCEEDNVTN